MKKPTNPPITPPAEDDLPVVEFVGLTKLPKGYVVVAGKIQGSKILDTETITDEPSAKQHAIDRIKIEVARRFIRGS